MADDAVPRRVQLRVYDISFGLVASVIAPALGSPSRGLWHTGIVYDGGEYFFGDPGVHRVSPGRMEEFIGAPVRCVDMGTTYRPPSAWAAWLAEQTAPSTGRFRAGAYRAETNNCNHFSDAAAQFLTGQRVPPDIMGQLSTLLDTPVGNAIRALLNKDTWGSAWAEASETTSARPPRR